MARRKPPPCPAPPYAVLIRQARTAPPNMSVTRAARAAAISDTRWSQIEQGYRMLNGQAVPEPEAPAHTVARMAYVVGVTAAQLIQAGRPDAAAELDVLPRNGGDGGIPRDIDTGELVGLVRDLQARVDQLEREKRKGQADASGESRAL